MMYSIEILEKCEDIVDLLAVESKLPWLIQQCLFKHYPVDLGIHELCDVPHFIVHIGWCVLLSLYQQPIYNQGVLAISYSQQLMIFLMELRFFSGILRSS